MGDWQCKVSVIMATYNRRVCLQDAVGSIRFSVGRHAHEIVVADGGSTDGSREWLRAQPDVILIEEEKLEGAVRAYNKAYERVRGPLICNFNDDCTFVGKSLEAAIDHMDSADPSVGQLAFEYDMWGAWRVHYERNLPCANVGLIRKSVADAVAAEQNGGFWNPLYYTYCADTEQSLWVWRLGYSVAVVRGLRVHEVPRPFDSLKQGNVARYQGPGSDTEKFAARWRTERGHP